MLGCSSILGRSLTQEMENNKPSNTRDKDLERVKETLNQMAKLGETAAADMIESREKKRRLVNQIQESSFDRVQRIKAEKVQLEAEIELVKAKKAELEAEIKGIEQQIEKKLENVRALEAKIKICEMGNLGGALELGDMTVNVYENIHTRFDELSKKLVSGSGGPTRD